MSPYRIEVRGAKGCYWFVLLSRSNGKVICTSETYKTKAGVNNSAEKLANALNCSLLVPV
jgi:uncharacterized protein YegP (UPF0339 family)